MKTKQQKTIDRLKAKYSADEATVEKLSAGSVKVRLKNGGEFLPGLSFKVTRLGTAVPLT